MTPRDLPSPYKIRVALAAIVAKYGLQLFILCVMCHSLNSVMSSDVK